MHRPSNNTLELVRKRNLVLGRSLHTRREVMNSSRAPNGMS
jgi:hypothetical protein